jgi:hypothetical protein
MLRRRVKNSETDRFITGRSKERDNCISKYLISDRVSKEKSCKKKLVWNEAKKNQQFYLTVLEEQLFRHDENLSQNIDQISRKSKKTIKNKNDILSKIYLIQSIILVIRFSRNRG